MTRYVWASTRSNVLHGSTRPAGEAHGGRGSLYELELLDVATALVAFDLVAEAPGAFAIVTRDQSRVDFLFGRGGVLGTLDRWTGRRVDRVTLDLWFEEDPDPPLVDVWQVSLTFARAFVEHVFADVTDGELWRRLGLPLAA